MAILMVVVYHSSGALTPLIHVNHIGNAVNAVLGNISPLGIMGVELFFVLSGFLIGGILIRTFMEKDNFSFGDVRTFWVRRWFRTLPNYWLILTVNILFYSAIKLTQLDAGKLLYYPFLQNLWYPHPLYFFGEAWSLSIEEWFYLTLPVALLFSWLVFKPKNKQRFLFNVFASYLLVFVFIRFFNAFHPLNGPDQDTGIRKVVLFRLDAVTYGVIFAWFSYFRGAAINKIRYILLAIGICGSLAIYYMINSPSINICNPSNPTLKFLSDAFLYMAIPLFFSFLLPCANSIKNISNRFCSATIIHISKISYSMYLGHYSLLFIPFFYYNQVTTPVAAVVVFIIYWILVIGLSSVIFRYFENPVMRLRERFSGK
jgi:peptidoglycan/LPS O-acetylase OafA/YrhL